MVELSLVSYLLPASFTGAVFVHIPYYIHSGSMTGPNITYYHIWQVTKGALALAVNTVTR